MWHSCAHCKNLSKDNDGALFTFFTRVNDYRMCIPWWNSPSVFDVTVWFHILSLGMPQWSAPQLCVFHISTADISMKLCAYKIHVATVKWQHNPETGKRNKPNNTWFMAGTAFSENTHCQILENILPFKNFLALSEYFTNPN